MDFKQLIREIKHQTEKKLAEEEAIEMMFSYKRPKVSELNHQKTNARLSAVNIFLFKKNNKIMFPLIKRPKYDGPHSQQISLPGGKAEKKDIDLKETAKRETFEEIGIDTINQSSVAQLSKIYIPPSNFIVSTYITYSENNENLEFKKDDFEVDDIIYVDINDIINQKNIVETNIKIKDNNNLKVKAFKIDNEIIWGATGIILAEFSIILNRIINKG